MRKRFIPASRTAQRQYHSTANEQSHRKTMDWVSKQLGIQQQKDWYCITGKQVISLQPNSLKKYGNSLSLTLRNVYPEFEWHNHLFEYTPRNYWTNPNNQRLYMDWVAEELGIDIQNDWYEVTMTDVQSFGTTFISDHYKDSLFAALRSIYPQFEWHTFLFHRVSSNFWSDMKNQRDYMDWTAEQLGIETQEDWYSVQLNSFVGNMLNELYNNSLPSALQHIYPEYEWTPYRFRTVGWTIKHSNKREYMDWIADNHGIATQEDWYRALPSSAADMSLSLCTVYPEFEWYPWLFKHGVPHHFWNDITHQKRFVEWIEGELQVNPSSPSFWRVLSKDTHDYKVNGWSLWKFSSGSSRKRHLFNTIIKNSHLSQYTHLPESYVSKGQQSTYSLLKELISGVEIHLNYRLYSLTNATKSVELDLYIPSMAIALEYQGAMHYDRRFHQGSLRNRIQRNQEKHVSL
jgi:hypothetical protein